MPFPKAIASPIQLRDYKRGSLGDQNTNEEKGAELHD